MDNAKGNKNWTILAGLAVLVTMGIVAKVDLAFGLPSHGHTDVDATIAKIIEKICNSNLATFQAFVNSCKRAISKAYSKVLEVLKIVCHTTAVE